MIPSSLHLDTHFFKTICLEACGESADAEEPGVLSSHLECRRHEKNPLKWMVEFGLKLAKEPGKKSPPYTFHFEIVGLFTVDASYPKERVEALVKANGPAVLYGAIREMAANLSARGPFSQISLPTVMFLDEVESGAKRGSELTSRSTRSSSKKSPVRSKSRRKPSK